jgi:hypothetical protein
VLKAFAAALIGQQVNDAVPASGTYTTRSEATYLIHRKEYNTITVIRYRPGEPVWAMTCGHVYVVSTDTACHLLGGDEEALRTDGAAGAWFISTALASVRP